VVEQVETFNEESETQDQIPEVSERPEWLPEKFNSVDDFVKSYGELESKLGSPKAPEKIEPSETTQDTPTGWNVGGVDMGKYNDEFQNSGNLSQQSYDELKEAGYPKEIVDSYIGGVKAQSRSEIDNLKGVYDSVGGMENYTQMVQWAATNMSSEEKASYNSINDSGNVDAIKMNVHSLHQRYSKANGIDPKLIRGDTSQSTGGKFESTAQIIEAMSSPKYKTDPAYRQEVYTKLSRSSVI
jgi:hypothetical protein